MKIESIRAVKANLNKIVGALPDEGSVVITKNGRPCAVLMPVTEDTDLEIVAISQNKRFWQTYDRAVRRGEKEGWTSLDDVEGPTAFPDGRQRCGWGVESPRVNAYLGTGRTRMGAESTVLTIERTGHVATLWLDNPARRNAMGPAFWDDLPVLARALSDDPEVRAVVLAGKGPHFTTGLDLAAFGNLGGGEGGHSEAARRQRTLHMIRRMQGSITALADCAKPVIAAVHGYCLGGGIDLITACDVRLASADAVFSVRETKIAIVADVGTLQRLPGIIGEGHVAELAFTGKDIPAARAKEIGLVNDVHADAGAVVAAARAMAEEIAANSPLAVQGTKAILRQRRARTVAEGLDYVSLWNTAFLQSNDLMEAMAAFVQKRPPRFTGE